MPALEPGSGYQQLVDLLYRALIGQGPTQDVLRGGLQTMQQNPGIGGEDVLTNVMRLRNEQLPHSLPLRNADHYLTSMMYMNPLAQAPYLAEKYGDAFSPGPLGEPVRGGQIGAPTGLPRAPGQEMQWGLLMPILTKLLNMGIRPDPRTTPQTAYTPPMRGAPEGLTAGGTR